MVKALTEEVRAVVAAAEQKGGQAKRGGKRPRLAPERGKKMPDIESGEEEGCEEARRSE